MWSVLREWRSSAKTLELNLRMYGAFYDYFNSVIIFTIQDEQKSSWRCGSMWWLHKAFGVCLGYVVETVYSRAPKEVVFSKGFLCTGGHARSCLEAGRSEYGILHSTGVAERDGIPAVCDLVSICCFAYSCWRLLFPSFIPDCSCYSVELVMSV